MKPRLAAALALAATWVVLSPHAAFADPPKEAELLKRIEQLEKRVAELEKVINKRRPSAKEPATETEKKLVGNWVIVPANKKLSPYTDLKFKADGTCALAYGEGMVVRDAKYQVTQVATVTQIDIDWKAGGAGIRWGGRIASVTDTELVLEYGSGDKRVKLCYARMRVK